MRVIVVGGGSVGSSIARELVSHGHEIVVIDATSEVIGRSNLRGTQWVVGDACDLEVLQRAKTEEADVVVAATGDDKANLVVSLLARSEFGVPRTVGRVNNPKNEWLFDDAWGVDVAVSTPRLMTALVEEAVEVGDVVRLLSLQTGGATLAAYTVPREHPVVASMVSQVPWPPEVALVAILRDGVPITPSGDDVLEGADELFFISTAEGEEQLRAMFTTAQDVPEVEVTEDRPEEAERAGSSSTRATTPTRTAERPSPTE
ncbi:potassium transporter TrkA [Kocuria sp. WRN011]|uniref:potassium channel family protein n=1 Tax=Kocuria TaxID=57493 RepID=UPI000BAF12EC|nr:MULTISPECIES: TrkA family potassium uptake protein [Kocuria]PBB07211.1 potassium transporter TrkA [Kocuria sp. WRN011]PZP36846.1 MAG: TrkA family potassium uptake protein [Kocuria rhizophila]